MLVLKTKQIGEVGGGRNQDDATIAGARNQLQTQNPAWNPGCFGGPCPVLRAGTETKVRSLWENQELAINLQVKSFKKKLFGVPGVCVKRTKNEWVSQELDNRDRENPHSHQQHLPPRMRNRKSSLIPAAFAEGIKGNPRASPGTQQSPPPSLHPKCELIPAPCQVSAPSPSAQSH